MNEPIYNPMHLDTGMDLRTYIATEAMAGLLANSAYMEVMAKSAGSDPAKLMHATAAMAAHAADALLTELNRPET